ncbi:DNA mismatch repair protein MSH7 [Tanacetum coccineum]
MVIMVQAKAFGFLVKGLPVGMIASINSLPNLRQLLTAGHSLHMKGLCHPYALGDSGGTHVPNDLCLGDDEFGYNPRGYCKGFLQLGSYVLCEMCVVLSPVDIIFTRLGATDRIMTGESTFLIECAERNSFGLCKMLLKTLSLFFDELGRGTSTFDGYAIIAYAVFRRLVEKVKGVDYYTSQSTNQQLVFLYRLANGAWRESYGLQVASMAGIPEKVVETKIGVSSSQVKSFRHYTRGMAEKCFSKCRELMIIVLLVLRAVHFFLVYIILNEQFD